jgi:hypothetical protein
MGNITQKWVNMLIPFTAGYSKRYTESELGVLTKIPQQSASRYLKHLADQNLVRYDMQGRNKLFSLDLSSALSSTLLATLENHKALAFLQKAKEGAIIINELMAYAEIIILFGSYASDRQGKGSDMDLVIVGAAQRDRIRALKRQYPIEINEHYMSRAEFRRALSSKNALVQEILQNHIIFGNSSPIVQMILEASR